MKKAFVIIIFAISFILVLERSSGAVVVDIDPDTLNLASKGHWVTAYIVVPGDCSLSSIDVNTIAITELSRADEEPSSVYIPADLTQTKIGDFNGDGIEELVVKFPRSSVQMAIRLPGSITITVEGVCEDRLFSGSDTIRAIKYYTAELTADLPEGISPKDVEIRSPCLKSDWGKDDMLSLSGIPESPFLIVGVVDGYPVVLSFFEPSSGSNGMSCLDTAVALIMVTNLLYSMPSNLIPEVLALIRGVPEVENLALRVCSDLSMSLDALVVPSAELKNAVEFASEAVNNVLFELIESGGNQTAN